MRVIAVDWSGAVRNEHRGIALAEVVDGRLVLSPGRWSRRSICDYLAAEARHDPDIVVGLDFAFSLPGWYLHEHDSATADEAWRLAEREGERWLRDCPPPFFGHSGTRRTDDPERPLFRQTDLDLRARGYAPKSVFQIAGAGQVGPGSVRGMPYLMRLREAGFAVWPFDPPRLPLVLEIYPRLLTGVVLKSRPGARRHYILDRCGGIDKDAAERMAASEDAFDAGVSALTMARCPERLLEPRLGAHPAAGLEGWIWRPDWWGISIF